MAQHCNLSRDTCSETTTCMSHGSTDVFTVHDYTAIVPKKLRQV